MTRTWWWRVALGLSLWFWLGGQAHAQPHAQAADVASRPRSRGVVVVTAGDAVAVEGAIGAQVPEPRLEAAIALARTVYSQADLTPDLSEEEVGALVGKASTANTNDERLRTLVALRGSLRHPVDDVTQLAILFQVASVTHCAGLLVVSDEAGAPVARFGRVTASGFRFEPMSFSPRTHASGYTWDGVVSSLRAQIHADVASKPPVAKPLISPKLPVQEPEPETTPFYESGWFWVALGAATALGVTALVVSQTVGQESDSVHLVVTVPF